MFRRSPWFGQLAEVNIAGEVVAWEVSVEAGDALLLAEDVVAELLPDELGTAEVDALATTEDIELDVVGVVEEAAGIGAELVCEVAVCADVDVEETNGGACWIYEPSL